MRHQALGKDKRCHNMIDNSNDNRWWQQYYKNFETEVEGVIDRPWSHPSKKYKSDVQMFAKLMDYFESNSKTQIKQVDKKGLITISKEPLLWLDLCHSLGMASTTIDLYQSGDYDDEYDNFSGLLAWAREIVEADLQKGAIMSVYNDRAVLVSLQKNHEWNIEHKIKIEGTIYRTNDELNKALLDTFAQVAEYLQLDNNSASKS